MKNGLYTLSILLLLISCKDPCKDVICENNGICLEGTCECQFGYEGTDCSTLTRDQYLGDYTVVDSVTAFGITVYNYNSTIAVGSDDLKITISNIYRLNDVYSVPGRLTAEITATGINIPSQDLVYYGTTTWNFSGSGKMVGESLIINYVLIDEFANEQTSIATFTK